MPEASPTASPATAVPVSAAAPSDPAAEAPPSRTPPRRRAPSPLPIAGLAVATALVVVAVVVLGSAPYDELSRNHPGLATSLASALLRLTTAVAGSVTLGGLVFAAFLVPRRSRTGIRNGPDLAVVRPAAAVWAVAAALAIGVDGADSAGVPAARLATPGALGYLVTASYLPGAWILVAIVALVVLIAANVVTRWVPLVALAASAAVAMLAPVLVTQVLVGPNHDFAGDAAMFATPAAGIWLGSTAAVVHRWRRHGRPSDVLLGRYRATALVCWGTWAAGTVVVAVVELAGRAPFATPTGWLFALQLVGLSAAAAVTLPLARPRRAAADGARDARNGPGAPGAPVALPRASARLTLPRLAALLAVQLVAAGVGVVMTRVPPPVYFVPTSAQQLFLGYDVDTPLTPVTLWTAYRVNILFLVVSLVGAGAYAAAVVRLRRRGDRWPAGRTWAWMLGWAVVVLTTSSGVGPYSSASFAVHMALHMSLNMLGPLLLVLGGPITLLSRATRAHRRTEPAGPHEWLTTLMHSRLLRLTYNPFYVLVVFIGSYYVIYLTPFFGWAMRYHWAHQAMTLHYLAIGYLFYALVIGVDAPPRPLPHIAKLGLVLAAMPFHAFFGVIVMTATTPLAGTYYRYLDVSWLGSLLHDQYVAGGIAWAAGELPLIVVVLALVTQWSRQDAKQARRADRHADLGLDDSFETYNAMLERLARRDGTYGARDAVGPSAAAAGAASVGAGEDGASASAATAAPGAASRRPAPALVVTEHRRGEEEDGS